MKKHSIFYIIPLLSVFVIALIVIIIMYYHRERPLESEREPTKLKDQEEQFLKTVPVTLFFHDPEDELLILEKRNIYATHLLSDRAKQTIIELMRGAAKGGISTIPKNVILRELYILEDGTAYVDFSKEFETGAEGGSSAQLMQIYSIVNSLTYNFKEIKRIAILIEGMQKESFGGHIYLGGFFREKLSVVKFPEFELDSNDDQITEEQMVYYQEQKIARESL